jgi:hypothetical protein
MRLSGVIPGLAALLTAFCLASCITIDRTIGSSMVPANQDITLHTATIDLPVSLKMADSLQTAISQNITVGAIRTSTFGLFHSDAAMSVTPSYDTLNFGHNPTVRSLTLNLVADTTLIMDASQRYIHQNFYVHQLNVALDSTLIYNNSLSDGDYDPEVISKGGFVYTGGDSYSVKIKEEIGRRLLQIPKSTYDSVDLFMKAFPGFYIHCDDPEEGMEGGRLNLFDLSASTLTLTYEYDDDEGDRKTNTLIFQLGGKYCVNVSTAGSRFLESADPADRLYMEGLCGIKPHINALRLKDAINAWAASQQIPVESLIIAKATFNFPFEYDGNPAGLEHYAGNIFPCKRKATGTGKRIRYTPIDEINQTDDVETGTINRSKLEYRSNVSIYIQNLIRRDRSKITAADDLWMMPTITYYNSTSGETFYYADYFYYAQSVLNGAADPRHPVVTLTYSILK